MTCPCHLGQTSLIASLASTLICPPQAQLSRGHCIPACDTECHATHDHSRVTGRDDTAGCAPYNERQDSKSATGSGRHPDAWKTSSSPSQACVSLASFT